MTVLLLNFSTHAAPWLRRATAACFVITLNKRAPGMARTMIDMDDTCISHDIYMTGSGRDPNSTVMPYQTSV